MKKILIISTIVLAGLLNSGCSATWDGVKKDSGEAYNSTKEAIHDATK